MQGPHDAFRLSLRLLNVLSTDTINSIPGKASGWGQKNIREYSITNEFM
jgi:hypothetical protein